MQEFPKITGKKPYDLHARDYNANGYSGLLDAHENNPRKVCEFAGYHYDPELFKRGPFGKDKIRSFRSNHGDICNSDAERQCDDLLWLAGLREHCHELEYPGRRRLRCDMVSCDLRYWFEYAGMLGATNKPIEKSYPAKLKAKIRLARIYGLHLRIITAGDLKDPDALCKSVAEFLKTGKK